MMFAVRVGAAVVVADGDAVPPPPVTDAGLIFTTLPLLVLIATRCVKCQLTHMERLCYDLEVIAARLLYCMFGASSMAALRRLPGGNVGATHGRIDPTSAHHARDIYAR